MGTAIRVMPGKLGRVLLAGSASAVQDDRVIGNTGMGGQGVLPVPVVYNGWVQQWVQELHTPPTVSPGKAS